MLKAQSAAPFIVDEDTIQGAMVNAWKPVARQLRDICSNVVDFKSKEYKGGRLKEKDIASASIKKAAAQSWGVASPKAQTGLRDAFNRPRSIQKSVRGAILSLKDEDDLLALEDFTTARLLDALEVYYTSNVWRHIAPAVTRYVDLLYDNPQARVSDMATLVEKIERAVDSGGYFEGLGNIGASRAYHKGFLEWAYRRNVRTYMILAAMDERTCPVCEQMHGKEFEVVRGLEVMDEYLAIAGDVEELKSKMPFPKREDVDNKSTDDLAQSPYVLPPYHGLCRCQLIAGQVVLE